MGFALPFVSDFGHRYYSYLMALTYNLVVRKGVDMVEHEAGRGFFYSEAVPKGVDGFHPWKKKYFNALNMNNLLNLTNAHYGINFQGREIIKNR